MPLVRKLVIAVGALSFVAACHHDRPVATTSAPPPQEPTLTSAQLPKAGSTDVSAGVSVSNEILKACKLSMSNAEDAPKFPFDQTDLLDEDYKVLNQIADCLTTGPLKERAVMLTGRADNRGTTEYNLTLGANRAHTVSQYLSSKGVDTIRMKETSRGELDATGTDVLGQKQDRRVDITLR
jgi:peptidoglycan-associated lipoprotein